MDFVSAIKKRDKKKFKSQVKKAVGGEEAQRIGMEAPIYDEPRSVDTRDMVQDQVPAPAPEKLDQYESKGTKYDLYFESGEHKKRQKRRKAMKERMTR